jgi:hypothetical protein
MNVFPFILRGVSLIGIDSADARPAPDYRYGKNLPERETDQWQDLVTEVPWKVWRKRSRQFWVGVVR